MSNDPIDKTPCERDEHDKNINIYLEIRPQKLSFIEEFINGLGCFLSIPFVLFILALLYYSIFKH